MAKLEASLAELETNSKPIAPGRLHATPVKILFDSGNLYKSIISQSVRQQLPVPLQELIENQDQVVSADNSPIRVLGRLKHAINLRFDGFKKAIPVVFTVVDGLTSDVNLGYHFMKKFRVTLDPNKDVALLGNHKIHLFTNNSASCSLLTTDNVQLKGRGQGYQWLKLKPTSSAFGPNQTCIVDITGNSLNGLHFKGLSGGLVTTDAEGYVKICVQNQINDQSFIPAHSFYGTLTAIDRVLQRPSKAAFIAQLKFRVDNHIASLQPEINQMQAASPPPSSLDKAPSKQTSVNNAPMSSANVPAAHASVNNIAQAQKLKARGRTEKRATPEFPFKRKISPSKPAAASANANKLPTREEVKEKLRFHLCDALESEQQREKLVDMILRRHKAFSFNGELGRTNLIQHEIKLKPGTKPVNARYRPLNPLMEQELYKQLREWLDQDIIEEAVSEWNSALVPVMKKDGTVRYCLDFRDLNDGTVKDRHPIGDVNDLLSKLAKSEVYSCVDNSSAYLAVRIVPRDRHKTCFSTPYGSFAFKSMPYGLATAPSVYARLVQLVLFSRKCPKDPLGTLPKGVLPYLDDTIIHTAGGFESHLQLLERTIMRFEDAGLRLAPKKCDLFRTSLKFLGHIVSGQGIGTCPEYAKILAEWPLPTTRKAVRVFYGKLSYYRKYVLSFAARSTSITEKLKDDGTKDNEPFEPSALFRKQFYDLRKALVSAPILAHPRFASKEPFILDTDFSVEHNQAGAVLSQMQDGVERVIAYGAVKLNSAQRNYSAHKGELAAVLIFVKKYSYFLRGKSFILRTDCEALKYMRSQKDPKPIVSRWLETLSQYVFEVKWRRREFHTNADALTRAPHAKEDPHNNDFDDDSVAALASAPTVSRYSSLEERFLENQRADRELRLLMDLLASNQTPSTAQKTSASAHNKHYFQHFEDLSLDPAGRLRITSPLTSDSPLSNTMAKLVLPQDSYAAAAVALHEDSSHKGRDELIRLLQSHFHLFKARDLADKTIKDCVACQKARPAPKPQSFHHYPMLAGYPFQTLSIDFVTNLPPVKGFCNLFTVKCQHTRFFEAFPSKEATTDVVIHRLTTEIFPRYSYCEAIHCDRGTHFTSYKFRDFCKSLRINLIFSPAFNPSSQTVERSHLDLKRCLTRMTTDTGLNWYQCLPAVLFSLRTASNSSLKASPFEAVFGRSPTSALDVIFGNNRTASLDDPDHIRHMQNVNEYIRKNVSHYVRRQRRVYTGKAMQFQVNDYVWLFTPIASTPNSRKFATYWTGPWQIDQKVNEVVYRLAPHPSWSNCKSPYVGVDRLLPYRPTPEDDTDVGVAPPTDMDFAMTGDEFAENIQIDADNTDSYEPVGEPPTFPPDLDMPPDDPLPPPPPPVEAPPDIMGEEDQNQDGVQDQQDLELPEAAEPEDMPLDLREAEEGGGNEPADLDEPADRPVPEPPPPEAVPPPRRRRRGYDEVRDLNNRARGMYGDDFEPEAKRKRAPNRRYLNSIKMPAARQQELWRNVAKLVILGIEYNLSRLRPCPRVPEKERAAPKSVPACLSMDWLIKKHPDIEE